MSLFDCYTNCISLEIKHYLKSKDKSFIQRMLESELSLALFNNYFQTYPHIHEQLFQKQQWLCYETVVIRSQTEW